jgi:hypothetical protein
VMYLEITNPHSAYTWNEEEQEISRTRVLGKFQRLNSSIQRARFTVNFYSDVNSWQKYVVPSNFSPVFGNPFFMDSFWKGVTGAVAENEKDYDKILEEMLSAHEKSRYIKFQTDEEMIHFIHHCEHFFKKSTEDHITSFEANGLEGNVDERRWYRFATHLLAKGKTVQEISSRS